MSQIVLLDTGILGMVTNPKANSMCQDCKQWLNSLGSRGSQAVLIQLEDHNVTIATTNVNHLSRFVSAKTWEEI